MIGAHPAFFAAMINNGLEVHDGATMQTLFRHEDTERHYSRAVFSPDGTLLAVFSYAVTGDLEDYEINWQLMMWDWRAQSVLAEFDLE